jgi:hypothetical protein
MLLPTTEIKATLAKIDIAAQEAALTLRAAQRALSEVELLVRTVREIIEVVRRSKAL